MTSNSMTTIPTLIGRGQGETLTLDFDIITTTTTTSSSSSVNPTLVDAGMQQTVGIAITNDDNHDSHPLPLFSAYTFFLIEAVFRVILIGFLSAVGVVTNVINLVVFRRQGLLKDSSTATLAALTVSDLLISTFSLWGSVCMIFHLFGDYSRHRWSPIDFFLVTAIRPKIMCTQITCWITAFLAFERVIGVIFPFRVKSILTVKRSTLIILAIFVLTAVLYLPNSLRSVSGMAKKDRTNATSLVINDTLNITPQLMFAFVITNPMFLRSLSILIVIFCNLVIIWKVNLSQKFRQSVSTSSFKPEMRSHGHTNYTKSPDSQSQPDTAGPTTISDPIRTRAHENTMSSTTSRQDRHMKATTSSSDSDGKGKSSKDLVLLRMITVVCLVFTLCYLPDAVLVFLFYASGIQLHFYTRQTLYACAYVLEMVNSASNIFIYYTLSSRFKREFRMAFCGTPKNQ